MCKICIHTFSFHFLFIFMVMNCEMNSFNLSDKTKHINFFMICLAYQNFNSISKNFHV